MFDLEAKIPQTVRDYLSNEPALRGIRMSVDALLKAELDRIPSINWDELDDFYKARTAAELTKLEWSIAMHNLWQHIWGESISPRWKICALAKLETEQTITIEECWSERGFTVQHEHGKIKLYTAIEIQADEIVIAFGLERGNTPLIKGVVDIFEWSGKAREWECWNVSRFPGNLFENPELIEDAKSAATRAMIECDEIITR